MADPLTMAVLLQPNPLENNNHTHMVKAARSLRRSACDDCRSRKVQCSGDITGCQRCRRAGIRCSYSPPKPPGRPRKIRKPTEDNPSRLTSDHHHSTTSIQIPPAAAQYYFGDLFGGVDFGGYGAGVDGTFGNSPPELFDTTLLPNFGFPNFGSPSLGLPPPLAPKQYNALPSPPSYNSWSSPNEEPVLPITTQNNNTSLANIPPPCNCLSAFFTAINTLRMPPTGEFSLSPTISTIRATLGVITTSMSCRYCHSTVQSTYVCMMLLGTLMPLLLLFIENSLGAISTSTANTVMINMGDVDVEVDRDTWRDMARAAVKKEFDVIVKMLDDIEGILERRYCVGPGHGKAKEKLGAITRSETKSQVGNAVERELTNKEHETGEPPFCFGLLWMIKKMAQRVNVGQVITC